jgi:3-hydroxyisobutyrate dehydrogenase-like beta-hydroxyacid dehydrogenase
VSDAADTRVAFCGLGRMGREMAARVAAAGFPLSVWNRTATVAQEFAAQVSATAATSPAAAAHDADVVVTMLTDGDALLSVLQGEDGVLAGLRPGAVVVDSSTSGPERVRQARELCAAAAVDFVDCPVSGSTVVASRGELGLMVGGDASVLERVRPVLSAYGRTVIHVGGTGAGAAAKVAVNGLLHTFSAALAEALVASESAGVAGAKLFEVLESSVLANTFLGYKREAFLHPESSPVAFDLATATKDLRLAADASARAGIKASLIEETWRVHRAALSDGYGAKDMAALAAWFGDLAGSSATKGSAAPTETLERT